MIKGPRDMDAFHGMSIPAHMADGLIRYIEDGVPPGGFLAAVLSNDLSGAVGRADSSNIKNIPAYVFYLYNYAPIGCWGSAKRVEKWIENRGLNGQKEVSDA